MRTTGNSIISRDINLESKKHYLNLLISRKQVNMNFLLKKIMNVFFKIGKRSIEMQERIIVWKH